jgi:AraC family transcriptional regulator, regulatory protein of adaptative response / methylated-DNA-[protein]-cysteine methyltransferase
MNALPPLKAIERAVRERDASFDGIFFIAVRTTGIFCRPSCPSRPTRPENRQYFASAREAIFAGYRPCKRCRPLHAVGRPPAWVERLLAAVEADPTARLRDRDLRTMGIDPARARRHFLKFYGMTFQAFCRGWRMGQALEQIRQGAEIDDVALGNGYESHSGFREAFRRTFGKPPGRSREEDCVIVSWAESPLGPLVIGTTAEGICLVEFTDRRALEGQFATLRQRFGRAIVPGQHDHLEQLKEELTSYFAGKRTEFRVPLVYPGTPFQVAVWDRLRAIPYGQTLSYEALARAVGVPGAQRAVGRANGQNRICILLPCHRVVNKDGRLGGYGGGLWRKQYLLDLERGMPGLQRPALNGEMTRP